MLFSNTASQTYSFYRIQFIYGFHSTFNCIRAGGLSAVDWVGPGKAPRSIATSPIPIDGNRDEAATRRSQ